MKYQKYLILFLDQFYKHSNWYIGFAAINNSLLFLHFFADLTTFIIPAITPTKKNININHGLVPNQLSKINPIIVPTTTAETIQCSF